MDVEGMEDDALEGAIQTILNNKPVIIIEIIGGTNWKTATSAEKEEIIRTQDKLRVLGYEVYQIQGHDYLALPK
jgi:transketolase N-terminal domain/subunit